jgi:hypothetical protein
MLNRCDHLALQILMADVVDFDDYRNRQSVRFSCASASMRESGIFHQAALE